MSKQIELNAIYNEDCHKDFHSNYGYGGNTKEQFDRYMEVKSEQFTLI